MEIVGGKYEAYPMDSGYNKFMMLKIRNITKEDFGHYKCVAKNSLGETDGIIKLDGNSFIIMKLFYRFCFMNLVTSLMDIHHFEFQ